MTIAILLNTSWNIYNFRLGLVISLQSSWNKVIAIAPYDEYVPLLENSGIECHSVDLNSKGTSIREDLRLIREYYKILKCLRPDLILSYTIKPNIYGNIASGILDIPVINNVSGLGTLFIKKSFSTFIATTLYRIAFHKTHWVFFQNMDDQKIFLKKKIQKKHKTGLIPGSGVDLQRFVVNRQNNKAKNVLFVGRLIGDKGVREFIEAGKILHKKYPDVVFNLVGQLGYNNKTAIKKAELESWINLPQFRYLGKSDNMSDTLKDMDIMVLPSYREGLSKSLIEACAMKLPVVATNVPGCREVVDDGINGFLCQPKNPQDLACKIEKIICASEKGRIEMGEHGRRKIEEQFDEKIVINNYLNKISELSLN